MNKEEVILSELEMLQNTKEQAHEMLHVLSFWRLLSRRFWKKLYVSSIEKYDRIEEQL